MNARASRKPTSALTLSLPSTLTHFTMGYISRSFVFELLTFRLRACFRCMDIFFDFLTKDEKLPHPFFSFISDRPRSTPSQVRSCRYALPARRRIYRFFDLVFMQFCPLLTIAMTSNLKQFTEWDFYKLVKRGNKYSERSMEV